MPTTPPAAGQYRIHLIDVGTGLSVLVQGSDFSLLFDGGSVDDLGIIDPMGNNSRLLSYLYAAIGPSGPSECVPSGDTWPPHDPTTMLPIQHVFLSHPHSDHARMLPDVTHCYAVQNFWDAGDWYASATYRNVVEAISSAKPAISYHTASPVSSSLNVDGTAITPPPVWDSFAAGETVTIGAGARLKVLFADGGGYPNDANLNSTVIRLDLGTKSVLLAGDAESGSRADPSTPPGATEKALLDNYASDLKVDILQVGHHGSKTSSRTAFLRAVAPSFALIGAGPQPFGGVVLPDPVVIDALQTLSSQPHILRTDVHDASGCPLADRIGVDTPGPGGCDNYILSF
jgi:competence protein ComEC